MPTLLTSCLAGLLALTATDAVVDPIAVTDTLLLDSKRSQAAFSIKVLWMITVEGQFSSLHGHVAIDRSRDEATVDARIDANVLTMRSASYANWVKSAEFFDVANFPEIRFQADSFPLSRLREGGELPGKLTLRGITGQIVLVVAPSTCSRPAIDCPVVARGTVQRSKFEMLSRRASLSDKVELSFSIYMSESKPHPITP